MKVLAFAFDSGPDNEHLPHNYTKNCVVYTGTHDNDTISGWFQHVDRNATDFAVKYLKMDTKEGYHWGMIRGALSSTANLAIIPMQDLLGFGSDTRMNIPSTLGGQNWRWRLTTGNITSDVATRLADLTRLYGRGR